MAGSNRNQLDWNLVRTFTAVVGAGSLTGAARELGLAHPTVARHVQQLEAQLGLALFERSSQGLTLNDAGSQLARQASQMRREAVAFERLTDSVRLQPLPVIRITMAELMVEIVPPLLSDTFDALRAQHTLFELMVDNELVNLLERGADIALRHIRPTQQDLVGRRVGSLFYTGYATQAYLERHGPVTAERVQHHRFIDDTDGRFVSGAASVGYIIPESQVVLRSNSVFAQRAAMLAGLGIAALPTPMAESVAESVADVQPAFEGPPLGVALDVWLVARSEMRDNEQVRSTFELLAESLSARLGNL